MTARIALTGLCLALAGSLWAAEPPTDPTPLTPGERTFLRHFCTPDRWSAICTSLIDRQGEHAAAVHALLDRLEASDDPAAARAEEVITWWFVDCFPLGITVRAAECEAAERLIRAALRGDLPTEPLSAKDRAFLKIECASSHRGCYADQGNPGFGGPGGCLEKCEALEARR